MSKIEIAIKFASHYKLAIGISDAGLTALLRNDFVTTDQIRYRVPIKKRSGVREYMLRSETKITQLWEDLGGITLIDAGLVDYLVQWIKSQKKQYDFSLNIDIPTVEPVQLSERWSSFLRDDQIEDISLLTRHYGGIASQHTGYGKTEVLIALIDSLPGNSVILVPNNGILREIQQRGNKHNIEIPQYEWTNKLNVVNPTGFLRSKESKKEEALEWLKTVENVFTDEAHYLQANSWVKMFQRMPNVKRAYGFSASPDTKKGKYLAPGECELRQLGEKGSRIVGLSGTTRVKRKSSVDVTLVSVRTEISNEGIINTLGDSWQDILDCLLVESKLARVIKRVFDAFPQVKFYLPVHKIESGLTLYENLTKLGISGIFWSAQEIRPEREDKKEEVLDYIKRIIINPEYRFLMTTAVGFEGIDIPSLSGIIPLTGKSYRMVMQPAGRSSRGGSLVYVLLYDKNNWLIMSQTQARRKEIVKEYKIVDTLTMGDE